MFYVEVPEQLRSSVVNSAIRMPSTASRCFFYLLRRLRMDRRFFRFCSKYFGDTLGRNALIFADNWTFLENAILLTGNDFKLSETFSLPQPRTGSTVKLISYVVIHARRGDYQDWRSGRYFFSVKQYLEWAEDILQAFDYDEVVICTNDISSFERCMDDRMVSIRLNNSERLEDDLSLMASSDWIVGPPSSFSMFASNYGSVPLSWIFQSQCNIHDLHSSRCAVTGFYRFENGLVLCEDVDQSDSLYLSPALCPKLRSLGLKWGGWN